MTEAAVQMVHRWTWKVVMPFELVFRDFPHFSINVDILNYDQLIIHLLPGYDKDAHWLRATGSTYHNWCRRTIGVLRVDEFHRSHRRNDEETVPEISPMAPWQ